MNREIRAVLFDLDGTLANTLTDVANATNWAFEQLGCPTHPLESYRMIGESMRQLCGRLLPMDKLGLLEDVLRLMRQRYSEHCFEFTRLYDGIPELVDTLAKRGFTLAVLSNKPDDSTKRMIAHYFKPSPFAAVHGQLLNVAPKPNPAVALQVARDAAIPPADWLCLGDTDIDMRTARAAGMFAVGALWGFRNREELLASGAQAVVAKPDEVLNLLA